MSSPELKYCGIHSLNDLKLTSSANATYLGFIFAPSRRKVDPSEVSSWLKDVADHSKKLVGVFVNPSISENEEVLGALKLDVIQLHGEETVEEIKSVREHFHIPIWKALHHTPKTTLLMEKFHNVVDGFVIDSRVGGQRGGTGVTFDWSHIPVYLKLAKKYQKKCFIAGGITPENVQHLLSYEVTGIDLSSGIEEKNSKSLPKIQQLEERLMNHVHISR
ncbi:phosphoribosylanthranilate isomerase [Metabacillus herbersteinensis]|uniref:N-(5'-phosphoribosyl)anthranilate isomerase n=1 Tax=Metabacillus herbersteinensis TaxID=283816 RepID=A0ABV6GD57_9BACI